METIRILLCCAGGMSSGFLASKMRKAAKKRGITATVEAVAESNVGQMVKNVDVLMVGPHYANQLPNYQKMCDAANIPATVIPQEIYGMLDGDGAVKLAVKAIEDYKNK